MASDLLGQADLSQLSRYGDFAFGIIAVVILWSVIFKPLLKDIRDIGGDFKGAVNQLTKLVEENKNARKD